MQTLPVMQSPAEEVGRGENPHSQSSSERVLAEVVDDAPPVESATKVHLSPTVAGLLNNRLAIITLLLVAGPLGLPALWFSGRFSRGVKIFTTVICFSFIVVLPLALVYYWCEIALRPLVDAFGNK